MNKSYKKTTQYSRTVTLLSSLYSQLSRAMTMDELCSKSTPSTLFWKKLKTLPRVTDEYQKSKLWYERIKKHHWKIGKACSLTEIVIYHIWNIMSIIICSDILAPFICTMFTHVRLFDEFICHQLEFLENTLKKVNTDWIYKPNGVIDRIYMSTCLAMRLMFIFPRLMYKCTISCLDVTVTEGMENLNLFMAIAYPSKPRRSRRAKTKASKKESPGKKRKHEEMDTTQLPDYFYVHEYSQESDPDFIPDSDHDTEVTSASENSHNDDSGEEQELDYAEGESNVQLIPSSANGLLAATELKVIVNDAMKNPEILAG